MKARAAAALGAGGVILLMFVGFHKVEAAGYEYMGFSARPVSAFSLFVVFILAIAPSVVLGTRLTRPSQLLLWLLYVLGYLPMLVVPLLATQLPERSLLLIDATLALSFCLIKGVTSLPRVSLEAPRFGWILIGVIAVVLYMYLAKTHGLRIRLVSLSDVYDVRDEFKTEAATAGRGATYALFWLANVLNPLLFAAGLVRRSPVLVAIGIVGQLVIFSLTGFKSVFFSCAMLLGVWLLIRRRPDQLGIRFPWLAAAGLAVTMLSAPLLAMFVRRMLVVGLVAGWYFEFFSHHEQTALGGSRFGATSRYPYDLPVPNLIAREYLNKAETSANGNFWADAFANFGLTGIVMWSFVLAVYLWMYDSAAVGKNPQLTALLLVIPAVSLSNVALQTALLTHGLALLLGVVMLLPQTRPQPTLERLA